MNKLSANANAVILPADLVALLAEKIGDRWTGTVSLNLKEGEIIAYEVTEKRRISRETHVSPETHVKGNSHGQQLPDLQRRR